ncbi:hypothetical protein [Fructobacillus pseudoficulneus]|nr:hypothetical protein [Fructobacillus pseudoficulneus]SEH41460.1 hypothetical protein SAMN05660469_0859 [Fructobacillus pseudoficulneus]
MLRKSSLQIQLIAALAVVVLQIILIIAILSIIIWFRVRTLS